MLPHLTQEGAGGPPQPGFLGGWLGRTHDPFLVLSNGPSTLSMPALSPGQGMTAERVQDRFRLLTGLNQSLMPQEMERFQSRACDLLSSSAARRAFQFDQESVALRDAYGHNIYGQSLLLSRRLVEAGTRLVCVSWAADANSAWDTHGNN